MGFTPEALLFAVFSVSSVIAALGVVVIRDPVKAALSLIACFFSISCLFVLQSAELLAVLEVLVYAGAIMVLFVFVIMLVENRDEAIVNPALGQRIGVPLKLAGVALVAFALLSGVRRAGLSTPEDLPTDFGSVSSVGHEFFDNFLFHFEVTSVLLLVGIVGAVVISKRRKPQA